MTDQRWVELMNDPDGRLTVEELAEGWHWCPDWDDLLVGPGMPAEQSCCMCHWYENRLIPAWMEDPQ